MSCQNFPGQLAADLYSIASKFDECPEPHCDNTETVTQRNSQIKRVLDDVGCTEVVKGVHEAPNVLVLYLIFNENKSNAYHF